MAVQKSTKHPTIQDRIAGSLLGLAAGDAAGYPHEFTRTFATFTDLPHPRHTEPEHAIPSWMLGRQFPRAVSPGSRVQRCPFSDDTQMTICVAEAMLAGAMDESVEARKLVLAEFLAWSASSENNRAPGSTVMGAMRRARDGAPVTCSGSNNSKGAGTVMRSAPYGWLLPPDRAGVVAAWHATITHGHPAGMHAAGALAVLVSSAIFRNDTLGSALTELLNSDQLPVGDTRTKILDAIQLGQKGEVEKLGKRYEGWCADDAIALAVGLATAYPGAENAKTAILVAAGTPGDSDTNACVVGALVGALYGVKVLPVEWWDRVEKGPYLKGLAARCAKQVQGGSS